MEQSNHNEIIVAGAMNAASNTGQQENSPHSPPYLKLIADCWEQIFDFLSFMVNVENQNVLMSLRFITEFFFLMALVYPPRISV